MDNEGVEGNKLNTATIEDLIFQSDGIKDLQFQITHDKKLLKILIETDNLGILDETKQRVNQYSKTNIGDSIKISKKSEKLNCYGKYIDPVC